LNLLELETRLVTRTACRYGLLAAGVVLGVAGLVAQSSSPAATSRKLARGKYLATIGACNDCHSPKIDAAQTPDPKRPFSGRPQTTKAPSQLAGEIHASLDLTAWAGPWGVSYGANLTPDPETGIGTRYTEASFIKTLRTGKKPEGEDLLPPMPWALYKAMSDDDIKALYAYLRTLPPIKNNVRSGAAPQPAAPAKK
jgi:cytochrome c553